MFQSPPTSHTDVRGPKANILINRDGHAYLADFSLVTAISDQETFLSSCVQGGTIKWMSPELLDPEKFGLKRSRPTKESDCYALGMVIYEILSGQTPFAPSNAPVIIRKVLDGERPERPQGSNGKFFTDNVWRVVQRCWESQPRDRASVEAVVLVLEGNQTPLRPSPNVDGDAEMENDDQSDITASDSGMFSPPHPSLVFNDSFAMIEPPVTQDDNGLRVPHGP